MESTVDEASIRLMTRAAVLYHRQKLTQREVAERMSTSRAAVGRLLASAEKTGIVTIRLSSPYQRLVELEVALNRTFGLVESLVVEPEGTDVESVNRDIARGCAELLARRLRPGVTLGLGWRRSLSYIGDYFSEAGISSKSKDVTVVQLDGSSVPGPRQAHPIVGIGAIADRIGAHHVVLPAPLYAADQATASGLFRDEGVRRAMETAANADICFFGVGSVSPTTTLAAIGQIDSALLSELAQQGAVGDIVGRYFDINGDPLDTELARRTISLPLERLKVCPVRVATAVGVAQLEALEAAFRGQLANALVTDLQTANALLDRAQDSVGKQQEPKNVHPPMTSG